MEQSKALGELQRFCTSSSIGFGVMSPIPLPPLAIP